MLQRVFGARPSDGPPALLSVAVPPMRVGSGPIDMRQWCTYVDDQDGNECVGEGLTGANWIITRGQGRRGSPVGVYVGARARERVRRGDALPDTGCQPYDAYDHCVAVGIEPYGARDIARASDRSQLNRTDTWDEALTAVKMPIECFAPLYDGDLDSMDTWLASGCPATYTQPVDASYMQLSARSPIWRGMQGPKLGTHRQVVVGKLVVTGELCYVVWNSYGTGWADAGFSYLPTSVFWQNASEIVVHRSGVIL